MVDSEDEDEQPGVPQIKARRGPPKQLARGTPGRPDTVSQSTRRMKLDDARNASKRAALIKHLTSVLATKVLVCIVRTRISFERARDDSLRAYRRAIACGKECLRVSSISHRRAICSGSTSAFTTGCSLLTRSSTRA